MNHLLTLTTALLLTITASAQFNIGDHVNTIKVKKPDGELIRDDDGSYHYQALYENDYYVHFLNANLICFYTVIGAGTREDF